MQKTIVRVFLGLLMLPSSAVAGSFFGSPHDFSQILGGARSGREACAVCHPVLTAKGSLQEAGAGMMARRPDAGDHFQTYTFMDGRQADQPSGISKLCLSCHDGTAAIDESEGGGWDHHALPRPGHEGGMGGDLTRTHPISVAYDFEPGDRDGLNDPLGTPLGRGGVIADYLPAGKVECITCHDIHGADAVSGTPLLRMAVRGSQGAPSGLCLACHRK